MDHKRVGSSISALINACLLGVPVNLLAGLARWLVRRIGIAGERGSIADKRASVGIGLAIGALNLGGDRADVGVLLAGEVLREDHAIIVTPASTTKTIGSKRWNRGVIPTPVDADELVAIWVLRCEVGDREIRSFTANSFVAGHEHNQQTMSP